MSDFVMMDYINETQEAALHIVDKSEDLCRVFAENFAKKPLHSSGKSDRIPLLTLKTEWKR